MSNARNALAAAAATASPTARRSGDTPQGAATVRMSIDIPRDDHRAVKMLAAERDITLIAIFSAFGAALADGDARAIDILNEYAKK